MTAPVSIRIWALLDAAWEAHAPMPTIRELCGALGLSSTSVCSYHIAALERAGVVTRDVGKARSIRLLRRFGEG